MLVAFNKIDLPAAREAWPAFQSARASGEACRAVAIAAATGEGIAAFCAAVAELLPSAEELDAPPELSGVVVHRLEAAAGPRHGPPRVGGRLPRRRPADRAARLADQLRDRGVGASGSSATWSGSGRRGAAAAGVQPGDTVRVGAVELEWEAEPWSARR